MLSSENNKGEIKRRIFFALWPDKTTRSKIFKAYNYSGFSKQAGRNFHPDNLHLTLHFLGNVSTEKFNCVMSVADQLEFNPFELVLNKFDVFQKAKIFYLGMTDVPNELIEIQMALGALLATCDFQAESRAFTPHVTLKQKIQSFEINEKPPEIFWQVNRFALVESVAMGGGIVYKPVQYFNAHF